MIDLQTFMTRIGLSAPAKQEFLKQAEFLRSAGMDSRLDEIAEDFFRHKERDYYLASLDQVHSLAAVLHLSPYTLDFLYMVSCGRLLLEEYRADGLSEDLFWDSMSDLRCKVNECQTVHHIWGIFVAGWYYGFWAKRIFRLGRLEYERKEFAADQILSRGDTVYSIHIPSDGSLKEEDVLASLQKAYQFFGYKNHEPAPFVCHSWLLYPANESIFPPDSNLMKFFRLFHIIESAEDKTFADCWRVFGTDLGSDPGALKQESTLQKNIVGWLLSGRHMGMGYGIFLFDGENFCPK